MPVLTVGGDGCDGGITATAESACPVLSHSSGGKNLPEHCHVSVVQVFV